MTLRNPPSWLQQGSHTAENDRLTAQAVYGSTGVIGAGSLAVTAQGSPNMTVNVAAGWAAIVGTTQSLMGTYVAYNDAVSVQTITGNSSGLNRVDRIVVTVNDAYYTGSTNNVVFQVLAGTPNASPVAPSTPANSISLATIAVANGASSITSGNITDTRTFTASNLTNFAGALTTNGIVNTGTVSSTGLVTATGGLTAGSTVSLVAGTTSVQPLKFAPTGATLSAPVAGSLEYDGAVAYLTPGFPTTTSGRGSIAAPFYYSLGSAASQSNATTIQPLFPGMSNGLYVQTGTLYDVEIVAGVAMGNATAKTATLTLGGTATYYQYAHELAFTQSAALATAANSAMAFSVTSAIVTSSLINATFSFVWKGQIRVNAAGYFLPQITYSVLPATASLGAGSYIKVTPVFAGITNGTSNQATGAWS